jgi:hypothetical protein
MRHYYNLTTPADSLWFQELHTIRYDEFAVQVDLSIMKIHDALINKLELLEDSCYSTIEGFTVTIEAFANDESFLANTAYSGETIRNDAMGIFIERGTSMDSQILSQLRAYFMILELQAILKEQAHPLYEKYKNNISFEPRGMGPSMTMNEGLYEPQGFINLLVEPSSLSFGSRY